jgi:ubiquinone/menaquinone biosynthesis C-methylase UbiE
MASTLTEGKTLHHPRLYDWGTALFGRRLRDLDRRVLERAAIAPGSRVLDVGCGPGRLTLAAAAAAGRDGETIGIDASPEMITRASEKAAAAGSPARFQLSPIEALPMPGDHFDVALASLMLHHLPGALLGRGLAEVRRVLRPGGRFVALDFRSTPSHGLSHVLCLLGLRRGSEHADHLRALLEEAGFAPVEVERAGRAFCVLTATKP